MSLVVKADGDLWVDSHHTVEDVGIVLGQALKRPWAIKAGINVVGFCTWMKPSEWRV